VCHLAWLGACLPRLVTFEVGRAARISMVQRMATVWWAVAVQVILALPAERPSEQSKVKISYLL
jgi:hypothetical protein